jgi:hypothetical protein
MLKGIAPKVLLVNEKPAPCECNETTVCGYCVQANLVVYEREQKTGSVASLAERISKAGVRSTARLLGVEASTVSRWVRNRRIPSKYKEKLYAAGG